MPIVRNLPDPAGTAAVVTAPAQPAAEVGGQPSAFQAGGVVLSCGPTGGIDQKNVNMVGGLVIRYEQKSIILMNSLLGFR